MLPTIEDLHILSFDEDHNPTSVRRDITGLRKAAQAASLDDLLTALDDPEDLSVLLGALALVPQSPLSPSPERAVLDHALEALIEDTRIHVWSWGTASYRRRRFEVGAMAAEARVALLCKDVDAHHRDKSRRRWKTEEGDAPEPSSPPVLDVLGRCLAQALSNRQGTNAVRAVGRGLQNLGWRLEGREETAMALARQMADAAQDPSRVAVLRCMAARELARIADAAPPGEHADALKQIREAAMGSLVAVVDDESADIRLRRQLRSLLMEVAPHRINDLQASGLMEEAALPTVSEVITHWGRPIEDRLLSAAQRVGVEAVFDALASDDPEVRLTGAALAPAIAPRADRWRLIAGLVAAIGDDALYAPEDDPTGQRTIDIGNFAAGRLRALLSPRLRTDDDGAVEALHAGLTAVLERAVQPSRSSESSQRFSDAMRWAAKVQQARAIDRLVPIAADKARSPAERFAAMLLARGEETDALAEEALLDPDTPPALRAWIGAKIHAWCPEVLPHLVEDTEARIWTPTPEAPETLPVSAPEKQVPLDWLCATVSGVCGAELGYTAVRSLGARLREIANSGGFEACREAWAQRATPEACKTLRAVLHTDIAREAPRWHAACALALLGEPEDIDALVAFATEYGPWTQLDPFGEEIGEVPPLEHLLLRPLSHPDPRHMIEPFLWAGYGEQTASRMMARLFVVLGGRAMRAGKVAVALTAYKRAQGFDPLNLSARRGARALGITGTGKP